MQEGAKQIWLATQAAQWAYLIGEASSARPFGGHEEKRRQIEVHLWGAHLIVLALAHLDRCLAHLRMLEAPFTPERAAAIDTFRDAFQKARVKELRDRLEHEEDRVADLNLHGRPKYEGPYPDPRITGMRRGRLANITVLDEEYDIEDVILAALPLDRLLSGWSPESA